MSTTGMLSSEHNRSCTTRANLMMSPRCHKVPKKSCHEQGHFGKCAKHGLPHSKYSECVQCASDRKVQMKAEKEARDAAEKVKAREKEKTLDGFLTPQKERIKPKTKKTNAK